MTFLALPIRALIRFYQWFVSPLLPGHCRHWPSCSHYALEAVEVHGPFAGAWIAVRRLVRCNPWGTWGYDPVPPRHTVVKNVRRSAHGQ